MTELDALFSEAEAYDGDPLRPDLDTPTPLSIVAGLTRPDRERRVRYLMDQAHAIYEDGIATHARGRELAASVILFSGGNDSTTLAHLFRSRATHAAHANTTIGIEETREYVRETCAGWALPLVEELPDDTYEDLVLGRVTSREGVPIWPGGFPGPGAHAIAYQRLKERALDKVRHTLGFANARDRFAVFIAGRRRQESERREDVPLHEADGTVVWISPLAMWTKPDLNTYRLSHDDVPTNPVTAKIHMSGECLCGAFAHPGELEELRYWYPATAAYLDDLGARARALGIVDERFTYWGHGIRGGQRATRGRLCSSCSPPPSDDAGLLGLLGEATA